MSMNYPWLKYSVPIWRTLVPQDSGLCGSLCTLCLRRCPAVDRVYCAVSLSAVAHGNLMAVPDRFEYEWCQHQTGLDCGTLEQLGHLSEFASPLHT